MQNLKKKVPKWINRKTICMYALISATNKHILKETVNWVNILSKFEFNQ